jgi:hypothetical protein
VTKAAEAAEVSVRCARKWVGRYRAEGELGLLDRSSAPGSLPHRTDEGRVQAIATLRRLRFTGPEIAKTLEMALSTVSGILTRIGMGKLGRLGLEPAVRYERQRPGELSISTSRSSGASRAVLASASVADCTNTTTPDTPTPQASGTTPLAGSSCISQSTTAPALAYAEVLTNEKASTVVAFLGRAVAFFERHCMTVLQLLTDNGSGYRSTVRDRLPSHGHPPPTHPRLPAADNGKAERFIRTTLGDWTYEAIYRDSTERTAALDGWLWYYNITENTQPSTTSPRSLASTNEPTIPVPTPMPPGVKQLG